MECFRFDRRIPRRIFFKTYLFEIFIAASLVSVISIILLALFIKETYVPKPTVETMEATTKRRNPFSSLVVYRAVFLDKLFTLYCLASVSLVSLEFMAGLFVWNERCRSSLFSYVGMEVIVDGIKMFGLLSAENALFVVALGLFVPYVMKRFSEKHVLLVGVIFFAVGYCVITVSSNPWWLFVMMMIATLGEITWVPVTQTLMARVIPEESRSTYLAVNSLGHQMAMMMGSLAVTLGAYLNSWAMSGGFLLTGVLSLLLFFRLISIIGQQVVEKTPVKTEEAIQA